MLVLFRSSSIFAFVIQTTSVPVVWITNAEIELFALFELVVPWFSTYTNLFFASVMLYTGSEVSGRLATAPSAFGLRLQFGPDEKGRIAPPVDSVEPASVRYILFPSVLIEVRLTAPMGTYLEFGSIASWPPPPVP